jgi:tRNA (guanosine-2'-O-)-methyltransferase
VTPRRFARLRAVLDRRQPDLTVVLDDVHNAHNVSAIVRTCDAVGVFEVHAVSREPRFRLKAKSAKGAHRWVALRVHPDLDAALAGLRAAGTTLLAAHPAPGATDFRAIDFTGPTAVLLGTELEGLSAAALARADGAISIPMLGAGTSLNVSVAAALVLFEAQRQRLAAGLYDRPRLDPEVHAATLFEWCHPRLAAFCRRKGLPYPPLADDGGLAGPLPRG